MIHSLILKIELNLKDTSTTKLFKPVFTDLIISTLKSANCYQIKKTRLWKCDTWYGILKKTDMVEIRNLLKRKIHPIETEPIYFKIAESFFFFWRSLNFLDVCDLHRLDRCPFKRRRTCPELNFSFKKRKKFVFLEIKQNCSTKWYI